MAAKNEFRPTSTAVYGGFEAVDGQDKALVRALKENGEVVVYPPPPAVEHPVKSGRYIGTGGLGWNAATAAHLETQVRKGV